MTSVSGYAQDDIVALGKAHTRSAPSLSLSQQYPQGCPGNSANVSLVGHESFPTREGGMLVASLLHSSTPRSDLNIGTPAATLPGAWRERVSAGTGRPGVSIL